MGTMTTVSRRTFLKTGAAATGALMIGAALPFTGRFAGAAETAGVNPLTVWIRIASDETVSIIVPASEMGQGIHTSLPMLVAEELEVDWHNVVPEFAPANAVYNNPIFHLQGTGGSTSVRAFWDPLRQAGAAAREMLIQAAADEWGVAAAECRAEQGRVIHSASGNALTYGHLAPAAAELPIPTDVALKPASDFSLIGRSVKRLDTPMKVNGTATFGVDVTVPGMLVGTVGACPVFGGKLVSVDPAPALAVRGVEQVVPLQDAVVVLGNGYWPSKKGLDALAPVWDEGPGASLTTASIDAALEAGMAEDAAVAESHGDALGAIAGAARTFEATYDLPFLAHATMEPMNATAHVTAEGVEIWAPTQGQGPIQMALSQILGIPAETIVVHTTFLGGGFGRKFELDFVLQAVFASKAVGRPVKLIWSREEDMQHDFYRPVSKARMTAGVDEDGRIVGWHIKHVSPSIMSRVFPDWVQNGIDPTSVEGMIESPYEIANRQIDYVIKDTGVPVGFWRAVGNTLSGFYVEGFLDEIARETDQDPVDMRLALLGNHPRHANALRTVARMGDWGGPIAPGHFRGVALHESFGSIVAEVIEISVEGDGIKVHRVDCAVDCGVVVNPDTIVAQMQSGIVYGLTAALYGEITIAGGRVEQGNFDTYEMLHMSEMPQINVEIIANGDAPGGIGEPSTPPVAAALASAVYQATGRRLRTMPLTKQGFAIG